MSREKSVDPNSLLELWEEFIEECEDGYNWEFAEYMNEITVRDSIHNFMKRFKNIEFEEKVMQLDSRFVSLLNSNYVQDKYDSWWKNGVLSFAGEEYVTYMKCSDIVVRLHQT